MVTVKKKGSRKTGPGVYEFNPEYKDIINKLKDKFGKGSYMYDLEPILKNYNSNGYDILNTAGNQLDTFGNKVILFDPESNEHLFISQLGEQKRNEKIIAFKEKYPNANYLNLDNGRFSNYMVNKEGINSDNAEEYMQNSFKGPDATGYNFAYQEGGVVPKAQAGTEQATISQYEEPAWYEKALDRLASPMTAFGYSARNQDVPDNLPINMEERNAHDSIIDTFNPFAWIKYGAQANRDLEEGEYLDAGLNILGALPIVPAWLSKTKKVLPPAVVNKIATYTDDAVKVSEKLKRYSPEGANSFSELMRTPINQLPYFKLNPNKFKPDPNKFYYRGIGRSGIEDAINSGVVRPPTGSTFGDALYMSANVNVADKYASDAASVFNKNFWKSDADPTKYIAEIPITSLTNPNSKEAFKRMNKLGSTFHEYVEPNSIPSSGVNFYKQNWLKGYKKFNFQNGGWLDKFEDGQYTYGGALPQAQFGGLGRYLKPLIKQGVKYADEFFNPQIVDNFKFKNLPTVDKKQFMKVVDGEFDTIDYDHLIPTTQEISDLATKTRSRLMSDKFIKNNMEATGRSKDEVVGYIDDYIKEFENSTLAFDKTRGGAAGLYTRGKITIDPRNPHLTKENVLGTLEHEIEHMFSNVGQQGSDLYRHPKFKLVDRTGMPDESLVQNMGQAFEQQVRFRKALGWLEKNAGLKVGDDVTDKQVETLTDAIANWSKEGGKDFRGTGANFDIQHLFSNLDAEQFLKPGQFLMPNAPRAANLKNSNVRQGIKDILNKTYAVGAVGGLGAASQMGPKQEDGQYAYGGSLSKLYQDGGEQPKTWKDIKINKDGLKRAIAEVESINGVLMINPESTATGLYGQRFSELEEGKLYEGTRDEFAKDLEAQNRIFDMRLNEGIKSNKTTPLLKDAFDLTNEYKDQLGDKWNYSYEDLIALSNFLGRGGTREFLGNVIRDGKTLEEVYPTKFGKDAKQANKTPYEYLEKTRGYYQKGGSTTNPYTIYKNYINGVYRGSKMESKAEKIYDKLNRLHYRDAKANQMTPANYVLTHVIG